MVYSFVLDQFCVCWLCLSCLVSMDSTGNHQNDCEEWKKRRGTFLCITVIDAELPTGWLTNCQSEHVRGTMLNIDLTSLKLASKTSAQSKAREGQRTLSSFFFIDPQNGLENEAEKALWHRSLRDSLLIYQKSRHGLFILFLKTGRLKMSCSSYVLNQACCDTFSGCS